MITEEIILKALDKCLDKAEGEQRRVLLWMKAALQYPGLDQFIKEVRAATLFQGQVSRESIHSAFELLNRSMNFKYWAFR